MNRNNSVRETIEIDPAHVQRLRSQLHAQAFLPGDDGYEQACTAWGWEGPAIQCPALILFPTDTADVVTAVNFAREQGLPIGVHGSGHGHLPHVDDALCICLERHMTRMQVYPDTATMRIEAGLRWASVIEEAHRYGLAPLNGFASIVGVVGYLLGGGWGWLVRQYGLGACSIRTAEWA